MTVVRVAIAILVAMVLWFGLNLVAHGTVLMPLYRETAELWRPDDQMNFAAIQGANLALVVAQVLGYACFVRPKSVATGLGFGALLGAGVGLGAALITYATMPVPPMIPIVWMIEKVVGMAAIGLVTGALVPSGAKLSKGVDKP